MTLDDVLNQLADVREQYTEISAATQRLKTQKDDLERTVESMMGDAGIKTAGNTRLKISLSEEVVPSVTDWEQVYTFIQNENAFYLLQKRMAAGAYREAQQMGMEIPGVEPFTKTKMSVTAA